jgi:hypothetical protein
MVEGRGLRRWEESMFVFRAADRQGAFQRALELGMERQKSECKREGWVDKRLAGIVELDDISDGEEIHLNAKRGDGTIGFDHRFEPERSEPQPAF